MAKERRLVGQQQFANPTGPGWADPADGSFEDPRLRGRDDKPYGPLPRAWAHYKGMYYHGNDTIISYTVGDTSVLEKPGLQTVVGTPVLKRVFNIGPRNKDMVLQVAHRAQADAVLRALPALGPALGLHRLLRG